jgi:hypothetical protein
MGNMEKDQRTPDIANAAFAPDRREFVKLAVGGALSAGVFASARTASATVHQSAQGIKSFRH